MDNRTDLAVESVTTTGILPEGIHRYRRGRIFEITEIEICDNRYISTLGKEAGRYITLEYGGLSGFTDDYEEMSIELAEELQSIIPKGETLIVGLGNRDITPDAVGPMTTDKIPATRHLESGLYGVPLSSMRKVSVYSGGVLGQTGIETAEIVHALCGEIRPASVVVIDALACSDIKRLGNTIQITDTGISPGSGVANTRRELSEKTLGVPVTAVGVPTVVDMHTIVRNITGQEPSEKMPNMMVTPRDIDRLIERTSRILAYGLGLALFPELTFDDVRGLF